MPTAFISTVLLLAVSSAPASDRYLPTKVDVDVDSLIADSPAEDLQFERRTHNNAGREVKARLEQALLEAGVPLEQDQPEAVVRVKLEWKVYLESHYIITIEAGSQDPLGPIVSECELCNQKQLATKVAAQVQDLLPSLERKEEVPVEDAAVHVSQPPVEVEKPGTGHEVERNRGRSLGPAGWIGLTSGVAGIVVTGWGAALLRRGVERQPNPDLVFMFEDDYRSSGRALLAVGSVVFATGVSLIVLDQTLLKKRRNSPTKTRSLSVSPLGQIVVSGRF